jgi:hypothetical protein
MELRLSPELRQLKTKNNRNHLCVVVKQGDSDKEKYEFQSLNIYIYILKNIKIHHKHL